MMWASLMHKGRTYKTVLVTNVPDGADDDGPVLDLALEAANENRSTVFGWTIEPSEASPTARRVMIHTD